MLRVDVVKVAFPAASSVPVPRDVVPSLNVTVPVGVAPVAGKTVAVNVTGWLGAEGSGEDVRVVPDTIWVRTLDVDAALALSPG